jgi:hypothetical protein
LLVEQALALVRQLRQACPNAPHGQVLAQAELVTLAQGRQGSRQALQAVLHDTAAPAEKKGAPERVGPCQAVRQSKGQAERTALTAAGLVTLRRRYLVCPACGSGCHPRDGWLGREGFLSPQARRLICLAAASWSFDRASALLEALCGLRVSDTTIRAAAVAAGSEVRTWQRDSEAPAVLFGAAQGDVEFSTDGTSVNTLQGWRAMRLAIFAKRPRGPAATPAQWDDRELPTLAVRVLFGGLWTAEQFGPPGRAWAGRLGIRQTAAITVLADGARWIGNPVEQNWPGASGVLDIYHASEPLYAAAQVLYGEEAAEVSAWVQSRRQTLLGGGVTALAVALRAQERGLRWVAQRGALAALRDYLGPPVSPRAYAERLRQGQSLGSGMVEGACQTVVGKRRKQTGARWRMRHAERMVALCGLLYSALWDEFWGPSKN